MKKEETSKVLLLRVGLPDLIITLNLFLAKLTNNFLRKKLSNFTLKIVMNNGDFVIFHTAFSIEEAKEICSILKKENIETIIKDNSLSFDPSLQIII